MLYFNPEHPKNYILFLTWKLLLISNHWSFICCWRSDWVIICNWSTDPFIEWHGWLIDWVTINHTHWFYQTWTIWLTIVYFIWPRFFTTTVTIYKILKLFHTFNIFHMIGSLFIQGVTLQLDTWKIFSIFLDLENVFLDSWSSIVIN